MYITGNTRHEPSLKIDENLDGTCEVLGVCLAVIWNYHYHCYYDTDDGGMPIMKLDFHTFVNIWNTKSYTHELGPVQYWTDVDIGMVSVTKKLKEE